MRLWKRDRRLGPELEQASLLLTAECSQYLTGQMRQSFEASGQPVPAWAWLNAVAHGDSEDLWRLARSSPREDSPESLIADLADKMLGRILRSGADLRSMQRATLIPLELALLEMPIGRRIPRCAADLGTAILAAYRNGPIRLT